MTKKRRNSGCGGARKSNKKWRTLAILSLCGSYTIALAKKIPMKVLRKLPNIVQDNLKPLMTKDGKFCPELLTFLGREGEANTVSAT